MSGQDCRAVAWVVTRSNLAQFAFERDVEASLDNVVDVLKLIYHTLLGSESDQ
jgi:hypothetical protein